MYKAVVMYHPSLMDDYRPIWMSYYKSEQQAYEALDIWFNRHPMDDSDPNAPESDLYYSFVAEENI